MPSFPSTVVSPPEIYPERARGDSRPARDLLEDVDRTGDYQPQDGERTDRRMVMASLLERASGITSVGLSAVAFVKPRYR